MDREYADIKDQPGPSVSTVAEGLRVGDYFKTYFFADGTIGRIDYSYADTGLHKVSYYEVPEPHEGFVSEHFARHPGVLYDVAGPRRPAGDGVWFAEAVQYRAPSVIARRFEVYSDRVGEAKWWKVFTPDNEFQHEERLVRDDQDKAIRLETYDAAGRLKYAMDFRHPLED